MEGEQDNYSLKEVTYPEGTTTHTLKGTKAGGESDKALLAEVERQKRKAQKAKKSRLAEVALLKQETEKARQAKAAARSERPRRKSFAPPRSLGSSRRSKSSGR